MKRRRFLKSTAILSSAVFSEGTMFLAGPNNRNELPIVDTHQHLVDFKRFGSDWSKFSGTGNFGIHEYEKAISDINMVKAVYMEVTVPTEKRYEEALYAIELCEDKSNPTVAAIIKADLYSNDFEAYMSKFKGNPYIKGIRPTFESKESVTDKQVIKKIQFLGDLNMSVDINVPSTWLSSLSTLIKLCPETKFQIDHCGHADLRAFSDNNNLVKKAKHTKDQWIEDMEDIASENNVACKLSGLVSQSPDYPKTEDNLAPVINFCIDIFGTDKVMFASDWPWCLKGMELKDWVNMLKRIIANRSFEDQKKLLCDNALIHYGI